MGLTLESGALLTPDPLPLAIHRAVGMTTGREADGPPIIGLGEHPEGPATGRGLDHPAATPYAGSLHASFHEACSTQPSSAQ